MRCNHTSIAICTFDNPVRLTSLWRFMKNIKKNQGLGKTGKKQNQSITGLSFNNALLKRSSRTNFLHLCFVQYHSRLFRFFFIFNRGLEFNWRLKFILVNTIVWFVIIRGLFLFLSFSLSLTKFISHTHTHVYSFARPFALNVSLNRLEVSSAHFSFSLGID